MPLPDDEDVLAGGVNRAVALVDALRGETGCWPGKPRVGGKIRGAVEGSGARVSPTPVNPALT